MYILLSSAFSLKQKPSTINRKYPCKRALFQVYQHRHARGLFSGKGDWKANRST